MWIPPTPGNTRDCAFSLCTAHANQSMGGVADITSSMVVMPSATDRLDDAIDRITDRIARDRPAAIAGPPPFWARLIDLPLPLTTAALDALVERGELRRQPLGTQTFYIADPLE